MKNNKQLENYERAKANSGLNFKQFRPCVILTEKDKARKRHNQKRELEKELQDV